MMTDELVDRLIHVKYCSMSRYLDVDDDVEALCKEAAEEIERLHKQWVAMKSEVQVCHNEIERLRVEINSKNVEIDIMKNKLAEMQEGMDD